MRFEHILLRNFRQYRDEKIDFTSWEPDRNITVIQGAIGAGKTNIMNAITWCFFGNEKHLTGKSSKGLGVCNTSAIGSLGNGDACEVEVEIALIDDDENRIYIKRSQRYEKDYQNNISQVPYIIKGEKINSLLQIDRVIDGETIREMTPSSFIQRFLPEDISLYFFFDGDKLNEYFEERSTTMAESVETISQIDLFDLAIRHLEYTEKEMVRKVKDPSEELKELIKNRERYDKTLKENTESVKELVEQQKQFEKEIKEIDTFLGERTVGETKEKIRLRKNLELEIARNKANFKDLEKDRISVCTDWGLIALAYPALTQTVDLVQEAEHAGKLPAAYKKNFLERMLKDNVCICGCSLEEGSVHRKEIEQRLMESDDLSDLSENLAHLSGRLRTSTERFPQAYKRLVGIRKKIKHASEELDRAKDELSALEKDLKEVDIEEVSRKETERQSLRAQSLNLEGRIAILENSSERWKSEITDLKNKISRAMGRDKKFKADVDKRRLCEDTIEYAHKIKDDIITEIRNELETLTEKYFLETHWKKGAYTEVRINDDYSISVKDRAGNEALGTLSRGETQVLAYAFVIALNIVSGFNFPLVIDTPLARISSKPRVSLGKALSASLEGRQLVFLMTDVEYTSEIKKAIQKSVCSEYKIDFTIESDMIGGEARLVNINE